MSVQVSADDVLRAIKKLRALGGGFDMVTIGSGQVGGPAANVFWRRLWIVNYSARHLTRLLLLHTTK